jgi:hypothetical protein
MITSDDDALVSGSWSLVPDNQKIAELVRSFEITIYVPSKRKKSSSYAIIGAGVEEYARPSFSLGLLAKVILGWIYKVMD